MQVKLPAALLKYVQEKLARQVSPLHQASATYL
jgi:hypothetical protein